MYMVFDSGAEEPKTFDQYMEDYKIGVLEKIKKNALHYEGHLVGRALMEFEELKKQGAALKDERIRLQYVQLADEHIAKCNAKIKELYEQEAAKKSRPRRKIVHDEGFT